MEHSDFIDSQLEAVKPELVRYCLSITGQVWEAEDLAQEAMIRLMQALRQNSQRSLSKAYLYRIALNLWRDECRRRHRRPVTAMEADACAEVSDVYEAAFDVRETLELLAHRLTEKQLVVLLLMDVFEFTAKETADFLLISEQGAQAALQRARARLRSLAAAEQREPASAAAPGPASAAECGALDAELLESVLEGFRKRDAGKIYKAYLRLQAGHIRIRSIQRDRGRLFFTLQDPDGHVLMIST